MVRAPTATACLLALVAGCKGAPHLTTAPDAGAPIATVPSRPPPLPTTLPSPEACARDTDCEVTLAFDGTGCCTQSFDMPMSKAHRAAVEAWAKTACAGYVCPPQPYPGARPAPCFFQARCVGGKCSNACGR